MRVKEAIQSCLLNHPEPSLVLRFFFVFLFEQNSLGFLSLDEVNDRNTDLKTLVEYRHLKFDGLARDYREAVEAMEAVERILE